MRTLRLSRTYARTAPVTFARRHPGLRSRARLGSFAKAAQELDTTSVSVSYHVRRLEQQTGLRLFVRHAQRVELTASGKLVAQEATNAFAALRASFMLAASADEARLSLTTLPTLGTSWLTPKLGRFRNKHPDIALDIDLSPEAQDLGAGRFDVAIRNGHGRWPGLCAIELFPSLFTPLCAPELKAAAGGIADPDRPAHDLVASDGRSFWFVFPVARHDSAKIAKFGDWVRAEAERDRIAAARYIGGAKRVEPPA